MAYVGYSGVANQANTSDGFALGEGAQNVTGTGYGRYVGDHGVVDLYGNALPPNRSFILMESTGYVLQEDGSKILLESS